MSPSSTVVHMGNLASHCVCYAEFIGYVLVVVWVNFGQRYAAMRSQYPKRAMLAIRYTFDKSDRIILVAKEDLMADNPNLVLDDLDALALTFGGPLAHNDYAGGEWPHRPVVESEWNPYDPERMVA